LPNIEHRWEELKLPVAKDKKEREKIKQKVKDIFEKRWVAQKELNNMKGEFGNIL